MKNVFLLTCLLIFGFKSFSQDSKVSFELNYPLPIGDNFIEQSFDGIIDLGVDYRFARVSSINIGASINGGVFVNNNFEDVKVRSYTVQPRIFGELDVESLHKFHPSIGIGYTFMLFDISNSDALDPDDLDGLNLNFGIAYDVTEKFFAQIQYDFIKFGVPDGFEDTKFNTNVNFLKIGFGYRL